MSTAAEHAVAVERPEYYIVKDGPHEYVVKVRDEERTLLTRSDSRMQAYHIILTDLCVSVREATPGQLLEAALGEPVWRWGDKFIPKEQPKSLFPEPPKQEKSTGKSSRTMMAPVCKKHQVEKHKNGTGRSGHQLWICPECRKEHTGGRARGRKKRRPWTHAPDAERPWCVKCKKAMSSGGYVKGIRRWKCKPDKVEIVTRSSRSEMDRQRKEDEGEKLMKYILGKLASLNGHDAQMREDIAGEMYADIYGGKLKRGEINAETVRRYIGFQRKRETNRFRDVSIDQPLDGEEGGQTLADILEG